MCDETGKQNSTMRGGVPQDDLLAPAKRQTDEVFKSLNALMDDVNTSLGKLDRKLTKIENSVSMSLENREKV